MLNQLQGMDDDWVVDLHDAVAVYRDYDGKLRVDQSYQMTTGEGAGWGGFWGSLIGLTLAIPFTGPGSRKRRLSRRPSTARVHTRDNVTETYRQKPAVLKPEPSKQRTRM